MNNKSEYIISILSFIGSAIGLIMGFYLNESILIKVFIPLSIIYLILFLISTLKYGGG